jgi:hypothetical protein
MFASIMLCDLVVEIVQNSTAFANINLKLKRGLTFCYSPNRKQNLSNDYRPVAASMASI